MRLGYGLIFSACSAAVMSGTLLDGARTGDSDGLPLSVAAASTLLAITLRGCAPSALVAALLMGVALAFGMTIPNVLNATMQPLPEIAGAVGAAAGSIQIIAGGGSTRQ